MGPCCLQLSDRRPPTTVPPRGDVMFDRISRFHSEATAPVIVQGHFTATADTTACDSWYHWP